MRRKLDMHHLMEIYLHVVDEGSFTQAAYRLGTKVSSVSKSVARLEQNLNSQLLIRTTRSLSLTDSGKQVYKEAAKINKLISELQHSVSNQSASPIGNLKMTATVAIGQSFLGPLISDFMVICPDVTVELVLTDQIIDYRNNDIDVAFQSIIELNDSSMYSIKVAQMERMVVASPKYLQQYGSPNAPSELVHFFANVYRAGKVYDRWTFHSAKKTQSVQVKSTLISNNYQTLVNATKNGLGIANLFEYLIRDELSTGTLIPILESYQQQYQNIHMLYSQPRNSSQKLDAFLMFMESKIESAKFND
ncbi:MAG: LysR family transcriptional regulator [Kangiellaceae bacterium]|nr:LysR family transcriptional regulator [Kangiellaceae bacterium]